MLWDKVVHLKVDNKMLACLRARGHERLAKLLSEGLYVRALWDEYRAHDARCDDYSFYVRAATRRTHRMVDVHGNVDRNTFPWTYRVKVHVHDVLPTYDWEDVVDNEELYKAFARFAAAVATRRADDFAFLITFENLDYLLSGWRDMFD